MVVVMWMGMCDDDGDGDGGVLWTGGGLWW